MMSRSGKRGTTLAGVSTFVGTGGLDSSLIFLSSPVDKYNFSPEINIYDDKVMIASWKEKLGIIIESEEIADAMKKIYELAWSEAKRLDSNNKTQF